MKERIIELCNIIKQNINCKGCGEVKDRNGNCKRCYSEDEEFKSLVDKLLEYLNGCNIDDDILLSLYNIRFLNCKEIHEVLNENNYNIFINKKYEEILLKFKNIFELKKDDQINDIDVKYIYYFLDNDYYDIEQSVIITNRLMALLMMNKITFNVYQKLDLVIYFCQTNMKKLYPNINKPKCLFEERRIHIVRNFCENVYLEESKVKDCLENCKYLELIKMIYYECVQTLILNRVIHFSELNYFNLLHTKDLLINIFVKGYYEENEYIYSHNTYARYYSSLLLLNFLKQFGWDSKYKDTLTNSMTKESNLYLNEQRKFNNVENNVDGIFDNLNIEPNILNLYPILKFEYKLNKDKVIRKTKEELEQDYTNYLKEKGDSKEIHFLFNKLISKVKNEELKVWFDNNI